MALLAGGEVRVDASGFACTNCHGGDAMGRSEGGTDFPPIIWSELADPARTDGAYDINSFMRAVREGVGVDGRLLSNAMPRYEVKTEQLEALVSFLGRLDVQERRGVFTTSIAIGFPDDPDQHQLFNRALSEANAAGGIWGRRFTRAQGDTGLMGWQELQDRLTQAFNRAQYSAVANYLRSASIESVSVHAQAEHWRWAMASAGIQLDDDATYRLTDTDAGPRLTTEHQPGAIVFQLRTPYTADEESDSVQPSSELARSAYVIGTTLADVIMDCGRAVTRSCVQERLDNVELSGWVEPVHGGG